MFLLDTIVEYFGDAHERIDDNRIVDKTRNFCFIIAAKRFVFLKDIFAHIKLDGIFLEQV